MNSFGSKSTLTVGGSQFDYYSLERAEKAGAGAIAGMPFSLKVMLENLLRFEDGSTVLKDDVLALVRSAGAPPQDKEIAFPSSARADAGFHRRSGRCGSCDHAGCHQENGRGSRKDQSASAS
jgi:aconitase A